MGSHTSTQRNFMSYSQPTFPSGRPQSWRGRRCSTLRTISQRRSPRLPGEPNRVGWLLRERIGPSTLTLNDGTPSERTARWSKSPVRVIVCFCRTPEKLPTPLRVRPVRSRSSSDSTRSYEIQRDLMKLLDIQSSPRSESSDSTNLTRSFIEACKSRSNSGVVDTLNVWHEQLPEF